MHICLWIISLWTKKQQHYEKDLSMDSKRGNITDQNLRIILYNEVLWCHHDISNHYQLNFLLNSLLRLTIKKASKLHMFIGTSWEEFTGGQGITLTKDQ